MAEAKPVKLSPEFARRAAKLGAAYEKFLAEMGLLKKERRALTEKVLKRIEDGKIDEVKNLIRSL